VLLNQPCFLHKLNFIILSFSEASRKIVLFSLTLVFQSHSKLKINPFGHIDSISYSQSL